MTSAEKSKKVKMLGEAFAALACVALVSPAGRGAGQEGIIDDFENLAGWKTGGQKEASVRLSDRWRRRGRHSLNFHVEVDHHKAEGIKGRKYPMGWPSVNRKYDRPIDLSGYDFIEFDVYFTSSLRKDPDFALNVTLKDADGRGVYGCPLTDLRHGKWAREKLCIRSVPTARSFQNLSFWISESSYDHEEVIDFFIDDLRATRAPGYRPPRPEPVRRPLVRADAAALWLEGPARKVGRQDEVELEGRADPIVRVSAARNEREAVQLVLRPLAEGGAGRVSVRVSDLSGPGDAVIPAANVSWSPVEYVHMKEAPPEGLPDPLPGPRPFVADKPWHYPVWLEVYVPPDAPAGDYEGDVTVRAGEEELAVRLRLHVWDFNIPVKQHPRTTIYIYNPRAWHEEVQKLFGGMTYMQFVDEWRPRIIELLAEYRFSSHSIAHLPLRFADGRRSAPPGARPNGGRVVLGDTGKFDRKMEAALKLGVHVNMMGVPYFFDRDAFLGAKKGTPEYLERITEAYRTAAQYLRGKGWLEGSFTYVVDEVVVHKHTTKRDFDLLGRVFDAIHAADPEVRIFGAETPSPILRGMDVYCMNIQSFDLDVLKEQHALGHGAWWYNGYRDPRPGARISARGVDHRVLFWMQHKFDIDGYLLWAVNRWRHADPWREGHNANLIYPNRDGPVGSVSPCIRLCMMRDGLEDVEYHWLLERAAEDLRRAGLALVARECRKVLQEADAFLLAYDNCAHVHPSFLYRGRRLVAEQIEKAREALKPGGIR